MPACTHVLRSCLLVAVLGALSAAAQAEQAVELKAKFPPHRVAYVETDSEVIAKSTSPMGNFDMTLRIKNGAMEKISTRANGTHVARTHERAAFSFDSTMGPSFYDSDIPDEEQSEQWEQILAPQIGATVTIQLNADHDITGGSGMEAIVKMIDQSAAGNMFWMYEKPRYTDAHYQRSWRNQVLGIFPDHPVRPGDTWTAPYLEEFAELKDFNFDCTYTLDKITEKEGRKLAAISFTGKLPADQTYESEGMMPIANIKVEEATLSGSATIDIDNGRLIHREDHSTVAFNGTMGPQDNAPKTSTARKITRTYRVKSAAERATEKKANDQLAAAKQREADKASAERRKRFAATEQANVDTASRANPIGIADSWPQWGGPSGDFKAVATGLADRWPESGPSKLWSRDLGDGYSAIASDGKRLYTMYRPTDEEKNKTDEYVIALDPESGKTIWEFKDEAPFVEGMDASFGRGPHSTPLIVGDRLFAVGATVKLHCLDKHTGKRIWTRDLHKEFDASTMMYGYGASPLAYKDTVILPIGGKGQAVIALNQRDGSVAWKNQDFGPTHASPFVVRVGDVDQLVLFSATEVSGLDPNSGVLFWRVEQTTEWGANISTPVWGADGMLFISAAYGMGSRGIHVTPVDGKPYAKELWHNRKMKIHHGNAVRVGNFVYGSSGDFGAVFYGAVDIKSGDFAWKTREVGKANSIYADGKMIILNERGVLYLARVSPAELKILSQFQLFEDRAWTTPTLVGKRLFVRDRHQIVALDLG